MKALAALLLLALFPSTSTLVLQFDASWREVHLPFVPTALHDGAPPEAKAYRAVVASCAAVVLTDKGTPLALGGRCFTQSNEAAIVKVKEATAAGKPKERATATAAKRKVKLVVCRDVARLVVRMGFQKKMVDVELSARFLLIRIA